MEGRIEKLETKNAQLEQRIEDLEKQLTAVLARQVEKCAGRARRNYEKERKAEQRRKKKKSKSDSLVPIPENTLQRDRNLPYGIWANVCFLFAAAKKPFSMFYRWLLRTYVDGYRLQSRKKIISRTCGQWSYFSGGVQIRCSETDFFGKTGTKQKNEAMGESKMWEWNQAHLWSVQRIMSCDDRYEFLPKRYKENLLLMIAPFGELVIRGVEYDPNEIAHQKPEIKIRVSNLFQFGAKAGLTISGEEHKKWMVNQGLVDLAK